MREALDTVRRLETPEGVVLELPLAGPLVRGLAFAVDVLLRSTTYGFVLAPLAVLGQLGEGITLILLFVSEWFYPVFFEVLWSGQTPGKALFGLAVVEDNGTPVSWSSSILRNLLRFADFLPMAYLAGVASMIWQPNFKRLGDLAAGTVVVHRRRRRHSAALPESEVIAVPFALTVEEQRSLIDFASRSPRWSASRTEELASLLSPHVGGPPSVTVQRLHGMARWLRGER